MQCHCKTECSSEVTLRTINPTITDELYREYLFTNLTIGDPCVPDDFQEMLDCLWDLFRFQSGCDLELQYLLVRLELIKILMGCKVYDIDRMDSLSESNSRSELTTRSDSESQSQQTGHSSGFADLVGNQVYDDFADSTLRAESQRTAYAEAHDESHQRMDDTGRGESESRTVGERFSRSDRTSNDFSESDSDSDRGGARRGYNYNHSASKTNGDAVNLGALGVARTATKNTWDQIMRSDTYDNGQATRNGFSTRRLRADAESQATTQRTSSSFFNALMDERIWGASVAKAEDHSRAQSDSDSHAEGLGQSATEQKAKSQGSNQGTSQSESKSTTVRDGTRTSYTVSDTIQAHQRFLALRDLYDATLNLIAYKRQKIAATRGFGIALISFCLKCGYIPGLQGDPMRARLCFCKQPNCPICCSFCEPA